MLSNSLSRGKAQKIVLYLVIIVAIIIGCKGNSEKDKSLITRDSFKPDTLSYLIKYDNSLFPLPSPYQAAILIKKHIIPFDENIPNKPENKQRYTTNFKKALNMGVYGTDLSYMNIYDRTQQSIVFIGALKRLSEDLSITPAFSNDFFSGIERNINTRDSLLVYLSKAYRKADGFLRENDRSETSTLILTGGWIESVYILTQIAKTTSNRDVINRIGQQKHPLDNIIEVLTPLYYKSPEFTQLTDMFIELAYEFDGIIFSYSYKEPKIDVENKITYIHSESRVTMSEYHLQAITKKVEAIRNFITE
jgi:hypothetical protein